MNEFVIETSHLCQFYANKRALHDLCLQIPRSGISAIIGSNGAGKSTLFRVLLGLLKPSSGHSKILGYDSQKLSAQQRAKIGFVNDQHTMPAWMKVATIATMQKSYYPKWNEDIYRSVVNNFNVQPNQKISQLSRGERAGVNLAMALAQRPEVLILDEPTVGLDVVAKRSFLEALLFTQDQNDCSVIYCSHLMEEVERVADYLIVMEQGELKNQSCPDDFVARVGYWIVDFAQQAPKRNIIPGLLQQQLIDEQYHYTVIDQGEFFKEFLNSQGGRNIHRVPVNLDRAINGFLAKNHASSQERN